VFIRLDESGFFSAHLFAVGVIMPVVDFETAITTFLTLGRRLQAATPLTGERVLDELTAWYRDSGIDGAAIDQAADMLLLQWGTTRPLLVSEPIDLRKRGDDNLMFAAQELRYLDFTRQVFVAGEDEEAQFDDVAVQMSITLGFQPADGTEPISNLWIETPDEIDKKVMEFREIPFVQAHLSIPAQIITIVIDHCG
jgi:hypothetical protein